MLMTRRDSLCLNALSVMACELVHQPSFLFLRRVDELLVAQMEV